MNELIQTLTSQLNINEGQAKGGVGILLNLAKTKLAEGDFSQITKLIGDNAQIGDLLKAAPSSEAAGGGGLMGMIGGLASTLGVNTGSLGTMATLAGSFKSINMDSALVQQFVPVVTKWLEAKGGDIVKDLLQKVIK